MIEIIDSGSQNKMLAMVIANIKYMDDSYVIYGVDRGNGEANVFVSKLVVMSEGYTFSHAFDNGEKEFLEKLVKRIINKDDIEKDAFKISNDMVLSEVNYFDIDRCYVATIDKKIIKDIMIFYKLVTEKTLEKPVVEIVEDKRVFNEGFVGNLFLIILGLVVVVFSIVVIVGVFR